MEKSTWQYKVVSGNKKDFARLLEENEVGCWQMLKTDGFSANVLNGEIIYSQILCIQRSDNEIK